MKLLQMSQVDNILSENFKSSHDAAEIDTNCELNMEQALCSKNSISMDMHQIDRSLKATTTQNKENLKRGEPDENRNNRSCTPANEVEVHAQPLTPTANLKVLFNAVSPELRNRDEQKQSTSDEDSPSNSQDYQFETVVEVFNSQEHDTKFGPSRKEKSLGLLCQKFLQKYPEYPGAGQKIEICLDEVAKELRVERRRIYDIVNVLESVEIVNRVAKNRYAWHGKSNLKTTLAKLKALGDSEGFGEQIQKLKDFEFNRELEEQFGRGDPRSNNSTPPDFLVFGKSSLFNQAALRKDKSLGIMSQKFLMLFLVSKPKTVNLDLSAKLLIGDANIDRTENAKFKTKIRRLYDIANILTSLNLIHKVHVTEIRGRKPAFKYIGPEIEEDGEIQIACCSDGCHRSSSRHSMLDCIQNQKVAKILDNYKCIKPVTASNGLISQDDSKLKFSRHSSFETLCEVAAVETNKMNVSSEPCSPVKSDSAEGSFILMEKPNQYITLAQLESNSKSKASSEDRDASYKLPTKGFVRRKIQSRLDEPKSPHIQDIIKKKGPDAIIIKTDKSVGFSGKQPTVIPLTKEQIDAVLRSLKVPIPVGMDQRTNEIAKQTDDKATIVVTQQFMEVEKCSEMQKPAEMQKLNERTPIIYISTPEKIHKRPAPGGDPIPIEKRIKLDFPSPLSSGEDHSPKPIINAISRLKRSVDLVKPSPQRALHLAPEFVNPTAAVEMVPSGDASQLMPVEPGTKSQTNKIEVINDFLLQQNSSVFRNQNTPITSSLSTHPVVLSSEADNSIVQQIAASKPSHTFVQLSNEPSTIHLPVVQGQQKAGQPLAPSFSIAQNVQILQGGQLVNLPCTFNPPLTLNSSGSSSPRVLTYSYSGSQSNLSLTNVHLVTPSSKGANTVATLIRPVATKAMASPQAGSQIVGPHIVKQLSPVTYFNNATGVFVPITNSASGNTKIFVTPKSTNCEIPASIADSCVS